MSGCVLGEGVLSREHSAEYYRARATEMMEKAQQASTKDVRVAYLNLAQKWKEEAEQLEAAAKTDESPRGKKRSGHEPRNA